MKQKFNITNHIKQLNREYVFLFILVFSVGLLIYTVTLRSQNSPEEILLPTFYSSPSGDFECIVARKYKDLENCFDFNEPDVPADFPESDMSYKLDPAGLTILSDLTLRNTANNNEGDIILNGRIDFNSYTHNYYIDLNSNSRYAASVGEVRTQGRIIMGANTPTPRGPNGLPLAGLHIWDISEGMYSDKAEAGDVVMISNSEKYQIAKTTERFNTCIAGVISEDPKLYMGDEDGKLPLALAGIVKCKVSAENGKIKIGDLLVSAALPGYAMRANPDEVLPGMLVGKALQSLEAEKGKILILVNKQ